MLKIIKAAKAAKAAIIRLVVDYLLNVWVFA
jgi:hypothetical protein